MPSSRAARLDLRGRPPLENHVADVIGQIQQLADRRASLEARAAALDAARALVERVRVRQRRIHAPIRSAAPPDLRRPFAVRADPRTSRCASTQLSADTN